MRLVFFLFSFFFAINGYSQVDLDLIEVANGFSSPVALAHANDGTNRLFVVEQEGIIRIIDNPGTGITLPDPFLDINTKVSCCGERGLLGLAFHPNFPDSPYFYVNYTFTELGQRKTKVERYSISANPNEADTSSALQIIEFNQPATNHNGGDMKFGPDGYLYIAVGDGGGNGINDTQGQNPATLLGSILRLNINSDDFPLDSDSYYNIPATNPFVDSVNYRDEFWAIGLRNPWRISFDRSTGDLWIGDVGQNDFEEIDHQSAASLGGENYGWSCQEGNLNHPMNSCLPGPLTGPAFVYPRSDGYSVTGGFVYRGSSFPMLQGYYVFTDFGSGNFWILNPANYADFTKFSILNNVSTFGESESGELYAARLGGSIYRVVDRSICEDHLMVTDHSNDMYTSEVSLSSTIPVTAVQDISYYSLDITINYPFEVARMGAFSAYAISCMNRILLQED